MMTAGVTARETARRTARWNANTTSRSLAAPLARSRTAGGRRRYVCLERRVDRLRFHQDRACLRVRSAGDERALRARTNCSYLPPDLRLLPRIAPRTQSELRSRDSTIAPQRAWLARSSGVESGVESTGSNWGGALSILRRESEAPTMSETRTHSSAVSTCRPSGTAIGPATTARGGGRRRRSPGRLPRSATPPYSDSGADSAADPHGRRRSAEAVR
jgi:hypothetical protein